MPIKKDDKYQVNENKLWFQKWWPEGVPKNTTFEEKTINEMLDEQVEKYPDHNIMWFLETWMTYSEFQEKVKRLATALYNLGIRKGDVVAMHLPNCFQYIIGYYAITRIGAIASGINPTYQSMEILHQLDIIKPKMLIVLDALYEPYIKPIIDKSSIQTLVYTNVADLADGLGFKRTLGKLLKKIPTGKVDYPGAIEYMELLETEPNVPDVDIDVKTHPVTYIMTGGTTGLPKAAVLTHFNAVSNAHQSKLWLGGENPGLGSIGVLPLFHSFAHTVVMNTTIAFGGWIMLFPKPPSTEELLETIEEIPSPKGLVYAGAEILFKRLAEFDEINEYPGVMGKLKLCVSGAGPLHRPVRDAFVENTGGRIVEGYGLTESTPVVSAGNLFGESPIGVIGMPFPGTEWGIWPADDFSKGPICLGNPDDDNFGEENTGEVCVHGPQVMLEYLNKPEETNDTIREYNDALWLLTGDIGFMNEDGTIELRDRKKQLIKYKGYSVYPKEVEELLMKHPGISEAAVAGIPHDEFGEAVKAWVELTSDSTLTVDEIKAWSEENMTHYKRPYYVEIISEVPKNLIGKVQRRILQINDPLYKEKHGEPAEHDKA
ncbi:MAG: AMP-binding protein [Candidatus Lokiarchaeota archaeon]|nr:AMP-binding protein [Candidatus Lokiarchaeota archaeon]MBD3198431.1 AMP-binding protein [Candidatus Lokiarchaeota archaeon]